MLLLDVGAVVVLLLFGIMLTRAPISPSADADSRNRPAGLWSPAATAGRQYCHYGCRGRARPLQRPSPVARLLDDGRLEHP